jgi:hypothetical protein
MCYVYIADWLQTTQCNLLPEAHQTIITPHKLVASGHCCRRNRLLDLSRACNLCRPQDVHWRGVTLTYLLTCLLTCLLTYSYHLSLGLPSGLFPSRFPTKTLYTPLLYPTRATCPVHLILLDFITRTIFGEKCRSLSSSLCSFLHSPVNSSQERRYRSTQKRWQLLHTPNSFTPADRAPVRVEWG